MSVTCAKESPQEPACGDGQRNEGRQSEKARACSTSACVELIDHLIHTNCQHITSIYRRYRRTMCRRVHVSSTSRRCRRFSALVVVDVMTPMTKRRQRRDVAPSRLAARVQCCQMPGGVHPGEGGLRCLGGFKRAVLGLVEH